MDPYLENPAVWPDFHDRFAEALSGILNRDLPQPYYAQLGVREEIGIVGEGTALRRIVPDVAIRRPRTPPSDHAVAVLDAPRADIDAYFEVDVVNEPQPVSFIEIRDGRREHEVVTLIEILSPSNKFPGEDATRYQQKRSEVFASRTSLIEIDLLREGDRQWYGPRVYRRVCECSPRPEYLILVQRAWRRTEMLRFQLFPAYLQQSLPVIAVPLREGEPAVPLDLQYGLQEAYDRGPYRRGAVDYSQAAIPTLPDELNDWADGYLRAAGHRE